MSLTLKSRRKEGGAAVGRVTVGCEGKEHEEQEKEELEEKEKDEA